MPLLKFCILPVFLTAVVAASLPSRAQLSNSWDARAAAAFLDQRAGWWISWPAASRDQGTFCVSCHTALPYALARPALRAALGQDAISSNEQTLLVSVTKRVRSWKDVKPFYDDREAVNKTTEARGTESVLNALILASYDTTSRKMSPDTHTAFDNMWKLQRMTGDLRGSWSWLQFDNEPWEGRDSAFYGAALAGVAVGTAQENYLSSPEIQDNVRLLRDYLNHEEAKQSLINQVVLLWASVKWSGLLTPKQRASIIDDIVNRQGADGGWNLASLAWTWRNWSLRSLVKMWMRSEGTPLEPRADGYATGLITFVLEQTGLPRESAHVNHGLEWLVHNQNKTTGLWPGYSLNRKSNPFGTGLFMSDAATAYAVLALTGAN